MCLNINPNESTNNAVELTLTLSRKGIRKYKVDEQINGPMDGQRRTRKIVLRERERAETKGDERKKNLLWKQRENRKRKNA